MAWVEVTEYRAKKADVPIIPHVLESGQETLSFVFLSSGPTVGRPGVDWPVRKARWGLYWDILCRANAPSENITSDQLDEAELNVSGEPQRAGILSLSKSEGFGRSYLSSQETSDRFARR